MAKTKSFKRRHRLVFVSVLALGLVSALSIAVVVNRERAAMVATHTPESAAEDASYGGLNDLVGAADVVFIGTVLSAAPGASRQGRRDADAVRYT